MQFNPITKDVFTDKGQFIKRMDCPLKITWNALSPLDGNIQKMDCLQCKNFVIDTGNLTDGTLQAIINYEPKTCIKISLSQANVTITNKVFSGSQK